jgi:glutathionylspermidine synthase
MIPQSKAFLAVAWQLVRQGFYLPEEKELIEKYLVPSYLEWPGRPCVIKPYLEREGTGVVFSQYLKPEQLSEMAQQDVVYQETVEVYPIDLSVCSTYNQRLRVAYPVLGAFLVGDEFAGLYTRLGAKITDRYAVVCPTLVKE